MPTFSERGGFTPPDAPITVREDAPHDLRGVLVDYAYEAGMSPVQLRTLVCGILMTRANPSNWSPFPNIDGEVRDHLDECAWYSVYDIAEAVHAALPPADPFDGGGASGGDLFAQRLNAFFKAKGIGWQLVDGLIQMRGEEAFEGAVRAAQTELESSGRATAASELHQALRDLSARPNADITGAIQHAMAALECALRDVTGSHTATLGQLITRERGRFPPPLDQALEKLWGFASEYGRHLREGRAPKHEDAVLVVHVAAAVSRHVLSTCASASG